MQIRAICSALAIAAFATTVQAQNDVRFDINRFQVEGNTLLPPERVNELVAPFAGKQRVYGDVQKALEALENAYRKAGYGTVQVFVPEQELSAGVVKLVVTEAVIGKVTLAGNKHFDAENIHNTLPGLAAGKAPNMRQLSENIQLANENPTKQIEVTLGVAEEVGKVDAKINVTDEAPHRFIVTADNTGTPSTGRHRIGLAYQHTNLFNADHIVTLAITGSPDLPDTPSVDRAPGSEAAREMGVASIAYRLPLYSIGDALDFAYGKSNTNGPVPTAGVTGAATGPGIVGKGEVYSLRWNHYLPRLGEYTSKVIVGYDLKDMIIENCVPTGNCAAVTTQKNRIQPVSFTYAGQRIQPGSLLDYNLGVAFGDQQDMLAANKGANNIPGFSAYRGNFSYLQVLKNDWALRYNFSGQYAPANHRGSVQVGLPAVEQFGVTGANMVRGFFERTVSGDSGYFMNFEAYTPEMAKEFNAPGSLKFLGFIDWGQGFIYTGARNAPPMVTDAGSTGIGLRYSYAKEATFRFDIAYVFGAGTPNANLSGSGTTVGTGDAQVATGDFRGHFNFQYIF